VNYEHFEADGEASGERLIVYSQDDMFKEASVTYVQTWEGDFVDKDPMLFSIDFISLTLPLQTPKSSDMTSTGRHWAYFENAMLSLLTQMLARSR